MLNVSLIDKEKVCIEGKKETVPNSKKFHELEKNVSGLCITINLYTVLNYECCNIKLLSLRVVIIF